MLSGPPLVEAATAAILESSCLKPEDQKSHLEAKLTALGYSWATPEVGSGCKRREMRERDEFLWALARF